MVDPSANRGSLAGRANLLECQQAIDPQNISVAAQLADVYMAMGRPDKAMAIAKDWLDQNGRHPKALKLLFDTGLIMNRISVGKSVINQALAMNLDKEPLLLDLGRCFEAEGRFRDARTLYRQLVDRVPTSSPYRAIVVARSAMTDDGENGDSLQSEITDLLNGQNLEPFHKALLYQAAAKCAEDKGEIDEAFRYFSAAGMTVAETMPPETLTKERVDQYRQLVRPEYSEKISDMGFESDRPIFVFGMHRSSTTLTEQILSSHPDVYGAGELAYFDIASNWFEPDRMKKSELRATADSYLELLDSYSADARRIVDKKPDNFKHLWLMAAAFPKASFVYCRRDPLDNCISCLRRPISKAYRRDLSSIGQHYRNHVALMNHWKSVLPVQIYELSYEALVSNPDVEIRKLIDHVGLEWNEACLTPHATQRDVHTPSRTQVSEPINTASIGTWRRYQKYTGPLVDALGDLASV